MIKAWLVHLQWGWVLVGLSLMGASWTAETVPSITWGPTWTTTIHYRPLFTPTRRLPPDPVRVMALLKELLALCDNLSQASGEKEECRTLAAQEAARWK